MKLCCFLCISRRSKEEKQKAESMSAAKSQTPEYILGQSVFFDSGFQWKPEEVWSGNVVGYQRGYIVVEFDYCVVPEGYEGRPGPQDGPRMYGYARSFKERPREPGDAEKSRKGSLLVTEWRNEKERLRLLADAKARIKSHELYGHIKVGDHVKWTVETWHCMDQCSHQSYEGDIAAIDKDYICTVMLADGSSKTALCSQFA